MKNTDTISYGNVDIPKPGLYPEAPEELERLVKEAARLDRVVGEAWRHRDASHGRIDAARRKDEDALAAAYAAGGDASDIDPSEHEDAARKEARDSQKKLAALVRARATAIERVRNFLRDNEEYRAKYLGFLVAEEERITKLHSELGRMERSLDVLASLASLGAGGTRTVHHPSRGKLQQARQSLEQAIGLAPDRDEDFQPEAPFEDIDVDVEPDDED